MTTQAATIASLPDSKPKPLHVLILGKCKSVRRSQSGKSWSHIVVCPAKDEFSFPVTVEFFAEKKLFEPEDSVVQTCVLNGRGDSYMVKDDDGYMTKVQTARLSLWAA